MGPRLTFFAFTAALILVGCGGTSEHARPTSTTNESEASTSTSRTTDSERTGELTDQFGERYCEVLGVTIAAAGTTAEVWGTQGLNDCPAEGFASIDARATAAELNATVAILNGPRYWVLDSIVANELTGSGALRSFGGVEMRSIATVELGKGIPDRSPYHAVSVNRDTEFGFDAGRTIYELTSPDGSRYVMQSYSAQVDPTLTVDDLGDLGRRLQLPPGWTFESRVLEAPLVVEDVDGVATVVQDELQNSYQLRTRA